MPHALSCSCWLCDERRATLEALTAIVRAGADLIITYCAPDAVTWLRAGK
jgi:porphobilinogen synthase